MPALRIASAIGSVGCTAILHREGREIPFTASIQPRLSATRDSSDGLGWGETLYYRLYAGADGPALQSGDRITAGGQGYVIRACVAHRMGSRLLYREAELTGEVGA